MFHRYNITFLRPQDLQITWESIILCFKRLISAATTVDVVYEDVSRNGGFCGWKLDSLNSQHTGGWGWQGGLGASRAFLKVYFWSTNLKIKFSFVAVIRRLETICYCTCSVVDLFVDKYLLNNLKLNIVNYLEKTPKVGEARDVL